MLVTVWDTRHQDFRTRICKAALPSTSLITAIGLRVRPDTSQHTGRWPPGCDLAQSLLLACHESISSSSHDLSTSVTVKARTNHGVLNSELPPLHLPPQANPASTSNQHWTDSPPFLSSAHLLHPANSVQVILLRRWLLELRALLKHVGWCSLV